MIYVKKRSTRLLSFFCAGAVIMGALFFTQENAGGENIDYDQKIKELERKAEEIQQKNKEREAEIEKYKDDALQVTYYKQLADEAVQGVFDQIEANDNLIRAKQDSINQTELEINELNEEIESTQTHIESLNMEIEDLNAVNQQGLDHFGQIIRAMYMTENIDPMALLAGSTNFSDLLIRTELVNNISQESLEFMNSLLADIEELEAKKDELYAEEQRLSNNKTLAETQKLKLENDMAELERVKLELTAEMTEAENKLSKYSNDLAATQNKITNLRQSITASNEEVEELNEQIAEFIRAKQRAAEGATVYSTDGFRWPLESNMKRITCYFGYDSWRGGNHYGIDVGDAGINGTNIYAAQSGTVIRSLSGDKNMWGGGFGNYIVIDHGDGISTVYAHCQPWSIRFEEGDTVEKGDVLGLVGSTGWATGPHLHFEVRVDGKAVNPLNYEYE